MSAKNAKEKTMKKLVTIILALSMLLALCACGSKNTSEPSPAPEASAAPTVEPAPTTKPEETPRPEDTPRPEETPEPEETAEPAPAATPATAATPAPADTPAPAATALTLQEIVDKMVEVSGFEAGPSYASYEVGKDDAQYVIGYEGFSGEFTEALGYGPLMGSIPFVMVVFRLPDGADAQSFADDIKANADLRKWICVEAETAEAAVSGNTVMFIMCDTATAGAFVSAFNQVMG